MKYLHGSPGWCNDPHYAGQHTYGRPRILGNVSKVTIGSFTSIADDVVMCVGVDHRTDWISTYPFSSKHLRKLWNAGDLDGHPASKGNIVIGSDVWIAFGATILSGTTIGHGAVVATRAVVTKNVLPYAIVAGNPARVVKYRFEKRVIESLLKLRWWDWPEEMIRKNLRFLCSPYGSTIKRD